jgi:23S rRNA-/tRNA-specific pseudouridylate synthase
MQSGGQEGQVRAHPLQGLPHPSVHDALHPGRPDQHQEANGTTRTALLC